MSTWQRGVMLIVFGLLLLPGLSACVSLKVISVDQKTQLENQILGTFSDLQKDLVLIQSVRGEVQGEAPLPPAQREALLAMMNRQFNADDVAELKEAGIAGERKDGLLEFFATDKTRASAAFEASAKRVIDEENHDRTVFIKRVIALNPNLSEKDSVAVAEMLYRLNVEGSPDGTRMQNADGAWVTKAQNGGAKARE